MIKNPYEKLGKDAFWRTAVAQVSPLALDIYRKKWEIDPSWNIAAAGSCFAQHISKHLRQNNFNVIDTEPAPLNLPSEMHQKYGYSMYSARFGNIYTMRQLLQLAKEAFTTYCPKEIAWQKDGVFYDALRPAVEPEGLGTEEEVYTHRKYHIHKVREMFLNADLFIFTFGLTEAWIDKKYGTVFPTVPGSIAGVFSKEKHQFKNFIFSEIMDDFNAFKVLLHKNQSVKKQSKFLLTVSPVPLTATNSGIHVLSATTYSKSILRAVAGQAFKHQKDVDYFPSFEIINNCWSRGIFYQNNMRSISTEGVNIAMNTFINEHSHDKQEVNQKKISETKNKTTTYNQFEDVACEEALLENFLK